MLVVSYILIVMRLTVKKKWRTEIIADTMQMLGGKQNTSGITEVPNEEPSQDSIPF